MKFKNGREIKKDDAVVGIDWRGAVVSGTAVTGDPDKNHPDLVFQHGQHKTVCPSLDLQHFLHADDAKGVKTHAEFHAACSKKAEPAPPTGRA